MESFLYFYDSWVSERLVQNVHFAAELQSVDDEVLLSGGDLHQAGDAEEAPVGMVLPWRTKQLNVQKIKKTRNRQKKKKTLKALIT